MTVKRMLLALSCVAVFFLAMSVAFAAKWVSNKFGLVSAEQISYHVVHPMSGVDPAFLYSFARTVAGAAAVSAVYAVFLVRTLRGKGLGRLGNRPMGWILGCVTVLMVGLSAGYVQYRYGIAAFFNPRYYLTDEESTFLEENYRSVGSSEVTFPNGKNNLVVLILESAEGTFNREDLFGEKLMPALDRVARENISFSRHMQCTGTGWSAAGICAYFLGVPLLTPMGMQKLYGEVSKEFLPGADSILRVLEDNGYNIDFMLGVDARFGGHDKVVSSHAPHSEVIDIRDFQKTRSDVDANLNDWGLTDSYLFERARERLGQIAGKQPFVLIVETMNSHIPGYPEPSNPRRWNDYRDCCPELDANTGRFLGWLAKQDFAADTTVVLLGDHLAMTEALGAVPLPPYGERSVYNAVVNSRRTPDRPGMNRLFASWDMAPTILESVGAVLPDRRFGLGVSLYSERPTLFEKFGRDKYEEERQKYSRLYAAFFTGKEELAGLAKGK